MFQYSSVETKSDEELNKFTSFYSKREFLLLVLTSDFMYLDSYSSMQENANRM